MKHQEKKLSSLASEERVLETTNKVVMGMYGKQNTVVGRSMWKLVRSVDTPSIGLLVCIGRAIPK